MTLDEVVERGAVVVCCGSGGVGKTTAAAALALEGARRGRRACVVTIDPAKRLADALGLGELTNDARLVEGDWPGELWALMLDTKTTFDDLVVRHAGSHAQAEAILSNRLYRNVSGALSGTQEYMATEKLHELHTVGAAGPDGRTRRFDLIVVDTPPTRHALDFLDAPSRLTRFLDNRVFRLLVLPTRAYLRAVGLATQAVLRTVSKAAGAEVVADAVAFFAAFEGMEDGFRRRAAAVAALLSDPATAFVLVAAPRAEAVAEAGHFAGRLAEAGLGVDAVVANRLSPRFDAPAPPPAPPGSDLAALVANWSDLAALAAAEEAHLAALAASTPAPLTRVPLLAGDVHDLPALAAVAGHLFRAGRPPA